MPRRRSHLRRRTATLAALLLLLGLFELNQWFPGGWPGGGGEGGFRSRQVLREDPARLRPPLGPLAPWPRTTLTVTVQTPSGTPASDWSLGFGDGRPAVAPEEGRALLADAAEAARGFRVDAGDLGSVEHGPAVPLPDGAWAVHLPDPPASAPAEAAAKALLRVVAAEDERPIEGAEVSWAAWGDAGTGETDADGRYEVAVATRQLRVGVHAEGRFGASRWIDPRQGPATFALVRRPEAAIRFVDPDHRAPLEVDRLRILDASGVVYLDESTLLPTGRPRDRLDLDLVPGLAQVEGAVLEVGAPDRPVVRLPLDGVPDTVALDPGRAFRVRTLAEDGTRVRQGTIHVRYVPVSRGKEASAFPEGGAVVRTTDAGTVYVPSGVPATLLVEGGASAPQVVAIDAEEEGGRLDVKMPAGGRVVAVVTDGKGGAPVQGARVVLVAAIERFRLEREAVTDDEGRATFADLPRAWVEVYAHAAGRAWAVATTKLGGEPGRVTLGLWPGRPLRLVVATPRGVPLKDVRVQAEPVDGEITTVIPPGAASVHTDEEGRLVLPDLPEGAYRLRLSKPGYVTQVVGGVHPGGDIHFLTLPPR